MFGTDIVALATQLAAAEPAVCDRDALAELVKTAQRARGWLDAMEARIALRSRELADQGACEAPGALLAGGGRRAAREAEAAAQRAGVCEQMPTFHDALADGEVSAGHVDAVARLAGALDDSGRSELQTLEPALVGSAKKMTVEEFARECSQLDRLLSRDDGVSRLAQQKQARTLKRWIDRVTGMCHTHLQLDPETDAKVSAALSEATDAERAKPDDGRNWDQLRADALVGLITGAQTLDPRSPEVTVLIDHDTLAKGLHDRSVCETADGNPLPPGSIRRLACDADIVPVVLGGNGEALDVGYSQRLATRAQRRALRAMYRHCAHPGCTVSFEQCRIHHVQWWDKRGRTDLANLLPLCAVHHHLVHEGGWHLTLAPERTITLRRPDGTIFFEGSTVDRGATVPTSGEREPARPGEEEVPLHVRRKARPATTPAESVPHPPASNDEASSPQLFDTAAAPTYPVELVATPKAAERGPPRAPAA